MLLLGVGPPAPLFVIPGAPNLHFSVCICQGACASNLNSPLSVILERKSKISLISGACYPLFVTPGAPNLQFSIYIIKGTYSSNFSSLVLMVLEKKLKIGFRGGAGHALIYDPRGTKVTI